ncbi:MAG: ABC transporter substrate-binding protein [Rhodospirillales bacterium]|jgi:iron(III) transport system substrate-binding protein|nr:ABC transporter substrate-binding protein [Rhodospirillales bacterium]
MTMGNTTSQRLKAVLRGAVFGVAGTMMLTGAAASADDMAAKLDAWLKQNQLGAYHAEEDWGAIIAAAKKEGEVVIYASSSQLKKVASAFMKVYPEIKVTAHKLGSEKSVEKTIREHDADIYDVDIVTTTGARSMVYEMLPNQNIINYVPSYLKSRIPEQYREPLLVRVLEGQAFIYNTEANPGGAPIKNIWELTEPKWKGHFAMKNPLSSLSTVACVMALVANSDAVADAYKKYAGKELVLSKGVKSAGYEFWKRMLANDPVIFKSGSKLAKATGKAGQKNPPVALASVHYLARNKTKGLVNAVMTKIEPAALMEYPTYTAIARFAPHPNAAKLITAFMMGSPELNANSKLVAPFDKGESAKLLQGLSSEYRIGVAPPRSDVPPHPDNGVWFEAKHLGASAEFIAKNGAKFADFWTIESSK